MSPTDGRYHQKYWNEVVQLKIHLYYLDEYHLASERCERCINAFVAIASGGSICTWAVWQKYAWVWALIIAASQFVTVVRNYLPYKQRLGILPGLTNELEQLMLFAEECWFDVAEGRLTNDEIHGLHMQVKQRKSQATRKYLAEAPLPAKVRLLKKAGKTNVAHVRDLCHVVDRELAQNPRQQKHFMAVPIFSCRAKHDVIGVLRIGASKTNSAFTNEQMDLLEAYSGYVSGLLTNYLKTEEERALIHGLFRLVGETDAYALLDQTARTIPKVMDGSYCSIFLKDALADDKFYLEATGADHLKQFLRKDSQDKCLTYTRGQGKTGRVAADGRTICVSGNIGSEGGKDGEFCECGTMSGAFLAAAIGEQNGRPCGVLRVVRSLQFGEPFDKDDQRFLEEFGRQLYACLSTKGWFARGTCFVIMPFGQGLDDIYKTIVKPTVECYDFVCRREDDFSAFGPLTAGIVSHIANATFIIADITGRNANVFYELGIAHTLEKRVILLSQDDPPADIQLWKFLRYKNTAGDAKKFTDELSLTIGEVVNSLQAKQQHSTSPIFT